MKSVAPVLEAVDRDMPGALDRLFTLLRFKSVGTDPQYHGECRKAADWLAAELAGMGFESELRPTTGQPLVVARLPQSGSDPRLPHVLFYGHYDVQPADPLELWDSPPFEPVIRKDKSGQEQIFARGASDDKGQLMTFIEACRAWLSLEGRLPFRLTVLLEGDEEGDSEHLDRFLKAHGREFRADTAWICDTDMWAGKTPAITTLLRGCISEEVVVKGPRIDLHSGYYGGAVVNPLHVLSRIMADLHDARGRVAIPHFYDGVKRVSSSVKKQWAGLKFNESKFLRDAGVRIPAGETGYSVLEQLWSRPTAECNGLLGGYAGRGSKTVLPAQAMAKFTFRLVAGQKPEAIRRRFQAFVRQRLPKDCKVTFISSGGDSSGVSVAEDSRWVMAARRALKAEWGRDAVLIGSGGSIPVVESFKRHLKLDSLLAGFAHESDNVHSPNEKYDVESFRRGIRSWVRIIAEAAKGKTE
jgi:acetylornithine deacetylase/succinyl-diaminopimelate desuccinylase-like protein